MRRIKGITRATIVAAAAGLLASAFSVAVELLLVHGKLSPERFEPVRPLFVLMATPGYEIPEALGWIVFLNATHIGGWELVQNFLVFGGTIFLYWLVVTFAVWYAIIALLKLGRWGVALARSG